MIRFLPLLIIFITHSSIAQVEVAGAMRNVMRNGDLTPHISLDSLKGRDHLYGIGPLDKLSGELMIYDGNAFISRAGEGKNMVITQNFDVKAPFFVYSVVEQWKEIELPPSVKDLASLEGFLNGLAEHPFTFRLEGTFSNAQIHTQNLPDGTVIRSPQDAHTGQVDYTLDNLSFRAVGYHSTIHQGIFTHHDSHVHVHLITQESDFMGHVDQIEFSNDSVRLWIQK